MVMRDTEAVLTWLLRLHRPVLVLAQARQSPRQTQLVSHIGEHLHASKGFFNKRQPQI